MSKAFCSFIRKRARNKGARALGQKKKLKRCHDGTGTIIASYCSSSSSCSSSLSLAALISHASLYLLEQVRTPLCSSLLDATINVHPSLCTCIRIYVRRYPAVESYPVFARLALEKRTRFIGGEIKR